MADVLKNFSYLSRVIFVIHTKGNVSLRILTFISVVKQFVLGKALQDEEKKTEHELRTFTAETKMLLHLDPSLLLPERETFRNFHDFSVGCGQPLGTVLVSERQSCRRCHK